MAEHEGGSPDSLAVADVLMREQQWVTDASTRSFEAGVEHWYKIILLAGGVLGIIVPLFASNPSFANGAWVRVAAQWLVACMVIGIVGIMVSRYMMIAMIFAVSRHYQRLGEAVGRSDGPAVTEELNQYRAGAEKWRIPLMVAVVVGDVAFYGCLVIGLLEMSVAVAAK